LKSNGKGGETVAQEDRPEVLRGKRLGMVVGINDYEDEAIKPLFGAEKDAEEICDRLRDPKVGGFDIPDHRRLIGKEATCKKIWKAISELFWHCNPDTDIALFYFSGHGAVDGYGDGYILPVDAIYEHPLACGINMTHLREVISRSRKWNNCVVMILDCCYSGIATKGRDKKKFDAQVKKLQAGEGVIVLSSSEATDESREISFTHTNGEEHKHGAYTACLLEALDGKQLDGQKSDGESLIIDLDALQKYAEERIDQLHPGQKPNFWGGGYKLGSVVMAVVPTRLEEFIRKRLEDAEEMYNRDAPLDQIEAAIEISEVLKLYSGNAKANELKNAISTKFSMYRSWAINYLNEIEAEKECRPLRGVFPQLQTLAGELNFDRIVKISDSQQRTLLSNLIKASGRESLPETMRLSTDIFVEFCKEHFSKLGPTPGRTLVSQ
jgi:hypothetical protein